MKKFCLIFALVLNAEFRIYHGNDILWEGYLYPIYVTGINA